jgi:uncharacterized protein YcfJ
MNTHRWSSRGRYTVWSRFRLRSSSVGKKRWRLSIIGGAIGNAVGHNKSNQRVGAVLGAVLGHSIGRDIVRNRDRGGYTDYQTVQRCETVYQEHEEERLIGYDVTYLYNGAEYAIRTETDPGEQIRLRVNVQPVL